MRLNKQRIIFLCQITENGLVIIKLSVDNSSKRKFLACEFMPLDSDSKKEELTEKINRILKKLEYKNNLIILSLPHKFATCRYLKIPTQIPQEIEKIVALQASTYLPSSFKELITGFLILSTVKSGYSDINLVIVQKEIIERYINIFNKLAIKNFKITLNSYGLSNLCNFIEPDESGTVMIIEIDLPRVELAISAQHALIFSRSFNISKQEKDWLEFLIEEVNKTKEAYLKEIPGKEPGKIFIFGSPKKYKMFEEIGNQLQLPVKIIPYWEKISCIENFQKCIQDSNNSLASIIGLGLKEIPESINLIPYDLKAITKNIYERKEVFRIIVFILSITLVLGLAASKNLDNKTLYLKLLTAEMKKIEKDAKKLEDFEKRLEFMKSYLIKKPASLDIIYGLYQAIPQNLSLNNFSYEEGNQIVLRGQTPELSSVFLFISQLEKYAVFKNFQVKVKYVTKKKTQSGEVVDFEIVCSKPKG